MMDPEPEAILVRYLASEIEPKKERNPLALSFFLAKSSEPEAFFLFFWMKLQATAQRLHLL